MDTDEELPEPCAASVSAESFASFRGRWLTETTRGLARGIVQDEAFERMPILADALEEAGCTDERLLAHCRAAVPHDIRCWVLQLVYDRQLRKRSWEERPTYGSPRDPAIRLPNAPFVTNEAAFSEYRATPSRPRPAGGAQRVGARAAESPARLTPRGRLRDVAEWVGVVAVVLLVLFLIAVFLGKPRPDWQGIKKAEGVRPPLAVTGCR